jgi:hypothetical protein
VTKRRLCGLDGYAFQLLPRHREKGDADIAKEDNETLTPRLNRGGQMLLHFGTSQDFIARPEKQNILFHLAKAEGPQHRYRFRHSRREAAPCFAFMVRRNA